MEVEILVCYEDARDVFVSRKKSAFPMATYLDMGNNYIYNVKAPINGNQGANKSYVDSALLEKANTTQFESVARQVLNKANNTELDDYLKQDGSSNMTGNLNMGSNEITGLSDPNADDHAVNKKYTDDNLTLKTDLSYSTSQFNS